MSVGLQESILCSRNTSTPVTCSGGEMRLFWPQFKWACCWPGARIMSCRNHLLFGLLGKRQQIVKHAHTGNLSVGLMYFLLELQNHMFFLFLPSEFKHIPIPVLSFQQKNWHNTCIPILHCRRSICMGFINLWAEKPYKLFMVLEWNVKSRGDILHASQAWGSSSLVLLSLFYHLMKGQKGRVIKNLRLSRQKQPVIYFLSLLLISCVTSVK